MNEIYRYQYRSVCLNQIGGLYSSIFIFFLLRVSTEVSILVVTLYFFWTSSVNDDEEFSIVASMLAVNSEKG